MRKILPSNAYFRFAVLGLAAVIGVLVCLYAGLQTPWAKLKITRLIERQLNEEGQRTVAISDIGGAGLAKLSLKSVEVGDGKGVWLEIQDVEIEWHPLKLILGQVDIASMRIQDVKAMRRPVESQGDDDALVFELPNLPVGLNLRSADIAKLDLSPFASQPLDPLHLSGNLHYTDRDIEAQVELISIGSEQTIVEADLSILPHSRKVAVRLKAKENSGGLITTALGTGLDEPLSIDLDVGGRFPALSGRALISLGNQSIANVEFLEMPDRPMGSRMVGDLSWPPDVAGKLPPYEVDVILLSEGGSHYRLKNGQVKDGEFELSASGDVNFRRKVLNMAFELDGPVGPQLRQQLPRLNASGFQGHGSVKGEFDRLALDANLVASGLSYGDIAAETLTLSAKGGLGTESLRKKASSMDLKISGEQVMIGGEDANQVALEAFHWNSKLGQMPNGHGWRVLQSRIETPVGQISAQGFIVQSNGTLEALSLEVDGVVTSSPFAVGHYDAFFNTPLNLAVKAIKTSDDNSIRLKTFTIEHPELVVDASGFIPMENSNIAVDANIAVENLSALGALLDIPLSGQSFTASAKINGLRDDPSAEFYIESEEINFENYALRDLSGSGQIVKARSQPKGSMDLSARSNQGPIKIIGLVGVHEVRSQNNYVNLEVITPKTKANGEIEFERGWFPVNGVVEADIKDLSEWAWFGGLEATGELKINAKLGPNAGPLDLKILAKNIGFGQGQSLEEASFQSSGPFSRDRIDQTLVLNTRNSNLGNVGLESLDVVGKTDFDITKLEFNAQGFGRLPYTSSGLLEVQAGDQDTVVKAQKLLIKNHDESWILQKPARLTISGERAQLSQFDLKTATGRQMRVEGGFLSSGINAELNMAAFPAAYLALILPEYSVSGDISGKVNLETKLDRANGRAELNISELRQLNAPLNQSANGNVEVVLKDNGLAANIELKQLTGGELKADLIMPVRYSRVEGFSVAPSGTLTGNVRGQVDLGTLWPVFGPPDQRLSGRLKADARIGGTVAKPQANGSIAVSGGQYQHVELGVFLDDINLNAKLNNREIKLVNSRATDGSNGSYNIEGYIILEPDKGILADIQSKFINALVVQRSEVIANASGEIRYVSQNGEKLISGIIDVNQMDIEIPDQLPVQIVELDVTEIGAAPNGMSDNVSEKSGASGDNVPTRLEVVANVPGRAFVRGRGINSEWTGGLKIKGTIGSPRVVGDLNVKRGDIAFLGKSFNVEKGQIQFSGQKNINPRINIVAENGDRSVVTIVSVVGPASQPKFELSSRPELPSNEILSQLLFGQTQSSLSAVQALQLADAARSLTGQGSGMNLLGRARQTLGLDVLSINGGENGEAPSISGGKYLTDRVYVEVGKSATDASDSVGVEIDVTETLSLETDLSSESGTNLGLKWEREY